MPEENVEVVRQFYDAYNARNELAWSQLIADDFRFESVFAGFEGRAYEGPAGLRRYFMHLDEAWSAFRVELMAIREAGPDCVIGYSRVHAKGKGSGVEIRPTITVVYRLREGKIVELETFTDRTKAHEAVGLSE